MTEKGTPPLPDPLPSPSGGEGENVAGAKHVPDVSRRKSWSYKTVHWQALERCSAQRLARISKFARTPVRAQIIHAWRLTRNRTQPVLGFAVRWD